MTDYCQSGFPKTIDSLSDFLAELQKRGADKHMIDIHYCGEPGTGMLHEFMWDAIKQGYIEQDLSPSLGNNTPQRVKLRMSAIAYLESRKDARSSSRRDTVNLIISIIVLLVSLIALIL